MSSDATHAQCLERLHDRLDGWMAGWLDGWMDDIIIIIVWLRSAGLYRW
jgi:hypothetical protein